MRLLWIATKPPAPPSDGGRLLQLLTLEALAARGARVTLVAPADLKAAGSATDAGRLAGSCEARLVPAPAPGPLRSLLASEPLAIARHRRPAVAAEVACAVAAGTFDAVHVEQIHALPQAEPARLGGLPVVVRAQNVESDLWAAVARRGGWRGPLARREARRLASWEGAALARAAAVTALTAADARRLAELAPGAPVERIAAPFPAELPPAERPLPGQPAVVLLGSGGWLPNRDAGGWFVAEAWPAVRAALSGAILHRFDGGPAEGERGVAGHPPPADSRAAFAPGAILAVPLRIASGVRMKILEAWARGVPVVASPAAAAGLDASDGRELLLASDAAGFATAIARIAGDPGLARALVAAGRAALAAHHDPAAVAGRLLELYRSAGEPR